MKKDGHPRKCETGPMIEKLLIQILTVEIRAQSLNVAHIEELSLVVSSKRVPISEMGHTAFDSVLLRPSSER